MSPFRFPALSTLGLLASGLILLAHAAWAAPPVDYHEPAPDPPGTGQITTGPFGQLQGSVPDRLPGHGAFFDLPAIDESRWVQLPPVNKPYWQAGTADPFLTSACQLGAFYTLPLNRIVVQYTAPNADAVLQVVPPLNRNLLVDPRGLARPGETYYFLHSSDTNCAVWVSPENGPVRQLDVKSHTFLPPPDPKELANKLALVKSWPKK